MFCDPTMTQKSEKFLEFVQRLIVVIFHFRQDADDAGDLLLHATEQLTDITSAETERHVYTQTHRQTDRQSDLYRIHTQLCLIYLFIYLIYGLYTR